MPKTKRPMPKQVETRKKWSKQNVSNKQPKSPSTKSSTTLDEAKQQHKHAPIIPFTAEQQILLVGEGDFTFAAALVNHHGCVNVLATTFESLDSLVEKYGSHASEQLQHVEAAKQTVLYSIDATKLSKAKKIRTRAWKCIWFNFPHVGGISKDVNRQVRANQALLAGFFASAKPLLATPDGSILVTIFEGEPYTLWNVRDLARHSGLMVRRSWRFDKEAYPGYTHARTMGQVKKKNGEVSETAWKGELRPARTYEFGLKDDDAPSETGAKKKRKRKRSESESDD